MKSIKLLIITLCLFGISNIVVAEHSAIVITKKNCQAYISGNYEQAEILEAKVLIAKKINHPDVEKYKNSIKSVDGIAIYENDASKCTTDSCSGIIRGKWLLCGDGCTGTNCKAIVKNNPNMCVNCEGVIIFNKDNQIVKEYPKKFKKITTNSSSSSSSSKKILSNNNSNFSSNKNPKNNNLSNKKDEKKLEKEVGNAFSKLAIDTSSISKKHTKNIQDEYNKFEKENKENPESVKKLKKLGFDLSSPDKNNDFLWESSVINAIKNVQPDGMDKNKLMRVLKGNNNQDSKIVKRGTPGLSRAFLDKDFCQALATPDMGLCKTLVCDNIAYRFEYKKNLGPKVYKDFTLSDDFAIYDSKINECYSPECRAIVGNVSSSIAEACNYNINCVAIKTHKPEKCQDENGVMVTKKKLQNKK